MGFRFRKRISIAPGVRVNLSKTGTSWSVGRRGASFNLGRGRRRATVGLPGAGLSWSKTERTRAPGGRRARPKPHHVVGTLIGAAIVWAILAHLGIV